MSTVLREEPSSAAYRTTHHIPMTRQWRSVWCAVALKIALLLLALQAVLCGAKEGDRGGTQSETTAIKGPESEKELYQLDGFICVEDECFEPSDLESVLNEQLRLSRLPHNCRNLLDDCEERALEGDCTDDAYQEYMHAYCPIACQTCHNRTREVVKDLSSLRKVTTRFGITRQLPARNHTFWNQAIHQYHIYSTSSNATAHKEEKSSHRIHDMTDESDAPRPPHPILNVTSPGLTAHHIDREPLDGYGSDLGVPQVLFQGALRNAALRRIQRAQNYFYNDIMVDNRFRVVREKCRNLSPYCAAWAALGHCESDMYEEYMTTECGPICETCHQFHLESKCPIDYNIRHAWYPGDLNAMFERILREQTMNKQANATILSSPMTTGGPWVLQIDGFLSASEADRLIELGAREGYERSEDVGDEGDDGEAGGVVSSGRTSTNAWCEPDTCEFEQVPQQVVSRIERLTGIHRNYSEVFQLLRYEPGQFYETHHDYIDIDRERIKGVRILTVFMYLNDVEEGGGTNFPLLGLTVLPKKGRIVLWPSVLNDLPHDKDIRTMHQALPVVKGIKYGANVWIHQRHFRVATYELFC